ncbi:MAG: hypothetical protein K0S53_879 [Bacteroidetes bacterium]|jgi:hypothetical protein|nr:hypothetical protein [Bacteroidota bacterium]MDF2450779.1 hypothetical protein [Bacteroidota bacterium]
MDFTPQINLLKGFCTLNFGVSSVDAELVFGKPEEMQVLDDPILETSCTVYHYWDSGFSLFFDNKNAMKFGSVEVDNKDTLLFGQKLFSLNEKQLTDLMKEHKYELSDTERQEWGEKRLSFDEAGLDCYFENGKLTSINFGVIDEPGTFEFLPN